MSALDLLIVGPASRDTGGVAQFLTEQQRHLPAAVDVTVHDDGTTDRAFGDRPVRALADGVRAVAGLRDLAPPDVVHIHSSHGLSFYRAAAYVGHAKAVWDARVVLHVHGSSFDEFVTEANAPVERIQSAVFDATDAVIVLSSYWRDVLAERVAAEKLAVVPNGVDPSAYAPRETATDRAAVSRDCGEPVPADAPTVAFVSNHVPRKGIGELVTALDRLYERDGPEFEAVIAGDGPLSDRAADLAARREPVTYRGYVSESEKRDLLRDADVYALPSHAEGLPIGLLEGMAADNAVVTTDVGAIPEVVDDAGGRIVDPGDVAELTDTLETLLADPESVREMGTHNRRLVEQRYAWDAVVERLMAIYESVTADDPVATTGH